MAFFPIDFRHNPYSTSFPFELRRVRKGKVQLWDLVDEEEKKRKLTNFK